MTKKAAKSVRKPATTSPKKSVTRSTARKSSTDQIEKACEQALSKLKSLKIAQELQAEIEWCLGSYRNDKNPVGLYEMAERALTILNQVVAKNAKAVSKKLLTDLEKTLNAR